MNPIMQVGDLVRYNLHAPLPARATALGEDPRGWSARIVGESHEYGEYGVLHYFNVKIVNTGTTYYNISSGWLRAIEESEIDRHPLWD